MEVGWRWRGIRHKTDRQCWLGWSPVQMTPRRIYCNTHRGPVTLDTQLYGHVSDYSRLSWSSLWKDTKQMQITAIDLLKWICTGWAKLNWANFHFCLQQLNAFIKFNNFLALINYIKQLHFTDAFSCYKQKWKLALFNLAHPVGRYFYLQCRQRKLTIEWSPIAYV